MFMDQYHSVFNYILFIIYTVTIIYNVISYIVGIASLFRLTHHSSFPGCLWFFFKVNLIATLSSSKQKYLLTFSEMALSI